MQNRKSPLYADEPAQSKQFVKYELADQVCSQVTCFEHGPEQTDKKLP
jgi:hypothetical protein